LVYQNINDQIDLISNVVPQDLERVINYLGHAESASVTFWLRIGKSTQLHNQDIINLLSLFVSVSCTNVRSGAVVEAECHNSSIACERNTNRAKVRPGGGSSFYSNGFSNF